MLKVKTHAPCRIDLFGGTLDLWPLYLWFQPSVTVNAALTLGTDAEIHMKPEGSEIELTHTDPSGTRNKKLQWPKSEHEWNAALVDPWKLTLTALRYFVPAQSGTFYITTHSAAPLGSGLAASSSQVISLVGALNACMGSGLDHLQLQKLARDLEATVLKTPAGEQDYFPALFGGMSALLLEPGTIRHRKISHLDALIKNEILVFYTGTSHHSGLTNWEIYQRCIEQDNAIHDALKSLAANSQQGIQAIQNHRVDAFKDCVRTDWELRKKHFPGVSTPQIEKAETLLLKHGISHFKVCGAAAGGSMFAFVPTEKRASIEKELTHQGMTLLNTQIETEGLTVAFL